jgi:Spy/CpxP family protein refolding chaperone
VTTRVPWWAVFVTVGLLGCGVAIGVAVDRAWLHRGFRGGSGMMGRRGPMGPPTPEQRQMMRARLARELSLSPVQAARIDTILTREYRVMESITAPLRPRMDSLYSATRSAIDSVLTPEQRTKRAQLFRSRGGFDRRSFRGPPR